MFRRSLIALFFLTTGAFAPADQDSFKLVILGDSLMAGFRLENPDLLIDGLRRDLTEAGLDGIRIQNAAVSGDTAAGALARFEWSVPRNADGVLVEIGANDMLQGRDPADIRRDIDGIAARAEERGLWIAFIGMRAPRNAGASYRAEFDRIYAEVADAACAPLYPFYFEGLIDPETGASDAALMLDDGLHPNADGVAEIVAGMGPWLTEALRQPSGCGS